MICAVYKYAFIHKIKVNLKERATGLLCSGQLDLVPLCSHFLAKLVRQTQRRRCHVIVSGWEFLLLFDFVSKEKLPENSGPCMTMLAFVIQ